MATPPAPTGRGRLWGHRPFLLFWSGETVSGLGDAMAAVAIPLVAVSVLHASDLAVSGLTATTYLPYLVLGLPAGAWVDRRPKRAVMLGTDVAQLLLFASLPLAAALGVLTLAQLLVVSLLAGTAAMLFGAASGVFVVDLVEPADLLEGNAKLSGSDSVTRVLGRGLGGLAAGALGPVTSLLFDAGSFLASFAGIALARPGHAGEPAAEPAVAAAAGPSPTTLRQDIAEGLALVTRDPFLRPLAVWATLANVGLAGYFALVVVFVVRDLHLGAGAVGAILMVGGLGGVAGALLARRLASRFGTCRTLVRTVSVSMPGGLLIVLGGPGPSVALVVAGVVLLEGGLVVGSIILAAFQQGYVPERVLARVRTSQRVVTYGVAPPAALLAGWLADTLGARAALAILLGAGALGSGLLWTGPFRGRRDLPVRG